MPEGSFQRSRCIFECELVLQFFCADLLFVAIPFSAESDKKWRSAKVFGWQKTLTLGGRNKKTSTNLSFLHQIRGKHKLLLHG